MYKWNSTCNSFEPYETEYETYTDENGEEQQREIAPTVTVCTQAEVDAIFSSRGANQVIKDVAGVPTAVDLRTPAELQKINARAELAEIQRWFIDNDWKVNKITTGEWVTDDIRWQDYLEDRLIKRNRQDELTAILEA